MEKSNRKMDWGDVNQFQNEIDVQAEWQILRKKLQRKKKNRQLFLLFLSVASSFLLFILWNGKSDRFNNNINSTQNLSLNQNEHCSGHPGEWNSQISSSEPIESVDMNTSSISTPLKNNHFLKEFKKSQTINQIVSNSKYKSVQNYQPNNQTIQQSNNLTIQQLNLPMVGRQSNNLTNQQSSNLTIKQFNNLSIQQFNNLTIEQFNNLSIQQLSNSTIKQLIVVHSLKVILPEFTNQKITIVQKPKPLTVFHFMLSAGQFNQKYTSIDKELNAYIAKRNSIEKPIYELGIASNLEFNLNSKFSLVGELNYHLQSSHINNTETTSYLEEQDNVLLEINKRPDGSEEQVRGKALVNVTKTIHAEYYNSFHTIAIPVFLKYNFLAQNKKQLSISAGISLASYSWAQGFAPDPDQAANYLSLNSTIKNFKLLDALMIRAEYGYRLSRTIGISLFGQYAKDISNRLSDDLIQLKTSSISGGIALTRYL